MSTACAATEGVAPDVFDRIRSACADVAADARHVTVDVDRIDAVAGRLATEEELTMPAIDARRHVVGEPGITVAYFVTLAAVNFGSGYFPRLRKSPGMSGYFTIASRLTDRFRASGALTADALAGASPEACAEIFGQSLDDPAIRELMTLFARAWNALGRDLIDRYDGDFLGLIEAAGASAARLVELLSRQPFFDDIAHYHGRPVPMFKRSQLLASDLDLALAGRDAGRFDDLDAGRFDDLDRLTIFADNLVPHVLRLDGILAYAAPLAAAIEREEPIPAGSDEEIEIRACSIHACELLRAAIARRGRSITSRQLDQMLWHRGQRPDVKGAGKRHRTRTVFY